MGQANVYIIAGPNGVGKTTFAREFRPHYRDRTIKLKLFARFDVRDYWIIDPNGPSAEIYRRTSQGLDLAAKLTSAEALTSPLFPGFSLQLNKLLAWQAIESRAGQMRAGQ